MKRSTFALLTAPAILLLALFFALPLAAVMVDALRDGLGPSRACCDVDLLAVAGRQCGADAGASTLSLVVGVAVALHLARMEERRRTLLAFVIALPLTFPA